MLEIVQSARLGERIRGALDRFVEDGLLVRPGERRKSALLFSHLLLASSLFVMTRTVRDTLFLSRYPLSALPWMFVLFGVASALMAATYGAVEHRMSHDRAIVSWSGVGIVTYLATWLCVKLEQTWIYPAFYVWSEMYTNLVITQFWALANDLHDARSQKRLFGVIGAARVLGVIVVGVVTGSIVRAMGTPQLLFVLTGLMLAIAALARRLVREPKPAHAPKPTLRKGPRMNGPLLRDPYIAVLSGMLFACFAALTVGDYQFKALARATYREDELAQFFSFFYAGTGVISFLFQLFVTPRLLSLYGVGLGMLVMPALFGAASALLLGVPSLAVASVMKFADNGFQYTIHDTTLQALYVPFSADLKRRARMFLDAVVKPLAYGLGGLILIWLAKDMPIHWLSVTSCVLVALWLLLVPVVRARYAERLTSTLHVGGLGAISAEPVMDAARRVALYAALTNPEARIVLAAVDELGRELDPAVSTALTRLVRHEEPAVRIAALKRLSSLRPSQHAREEASAIRAALADPVPEVRAAAALAHAKLHEDEAVTELAPLLDDDSDVVRSATLSGLLSHCGFEGAMVGGRRFAELLTSRDPEDREAAARALGGIGRSGARRLIPLLDDPDPNVRLAAAVSAHDVRDARLIPALVKQLRDPRMRNACASALSAVGKPAIAPLIDVLKDRQSPRELRLAVPRILRRIPATESYEALRAFAHDEDSFVREAVFAALSRLRRNLAKKPEARDAVRGWVEREIRVTLRLSASYAAVRNAVGTPLLDDAVEFSHQRGEKRVLRILELRYAPESLHLVRDRIDDPTRRVNALEVLDATLEPVMRAVVMPFLDDVPVAEKARRYGVAVSNDGDQLLLRRLENANPYSVLVALDAARVHKRPFAAEAARKLLQHPSALVREGATRALFEADPGGCSEELTRLTCDPDAKVARFARHLLNRKEREEGDIVLSTVDKLLVLRATSMFSRLRGDDLAPLAHVAEVESYDAGEVIFEEGDEGDALYVIIRGTVAITKGEQTLATLGANEAFGEMSALDEGPRSAGAKALEPTDLLRIGSEEFAEVLREQVEIAEGVIRILSRRLRETNAALERSRGKGGPDSAALPQEEKSG